MKQKKSIIQETIRISIKEGIFSQIFKTIAGPESIFITKFAILLNASPFHFAILSAIGHLSQVFRPLGVVISNKLHSRKSTVIRIVGLGRILAVFFGMLTFFFLGKYTIEAFLILFFVSNSIQAVGSNAWIAWIADLIPLKIRGRFFSWRVQYSMFFGLIIGYVISIFLDLFKTNPGNIAQNLQTVLEGTRILSQVNILIAFSAIFIFAAIMGIWSLRILKKQHERPRDIETEKFKDILVTPLKDKNFRKLLLYGFWWMLTLGIGAPFWVPFMMTKLGMTLVQVQIYFTVRIMATLLTLPTWGRMIDRFGNKTSMRVVILLGGITPLLWLFASRTMYWIIFLEAIGSGIAWAGSEIISRNFILAIAPPNRRQIYSGVFGAFSGIAIMITMLLSGIFIPSSAVEIFKFHLEPEQILFGITGIARWTTQFSLSWIDEPKSKSLREVTFELLGLKMPEFLKKKKKK